MKPPVLVVCFRRPRNLELILKECDDKSRDIFIFIDKSSQYDELNAEVCRVANSRRETSTNIKVLESNKNLGVRFAVPNAINWALESCDSLIVLEDDCIPNNFALHYFDNCIAEIDGDLVLVSGSTLPSFPKELEGKLYESKFPLIWGWALTKKSWQKIRPDQQLNFKAVLNGIFKNPNLLIPILYFYAAVIRVDRGLLNAWDSPVALRMLLENYKSIVPDCSVISNVGQDEVASHFEIISSKSETLVTTYGDRVPAMIRNLNDMSSKKLNKQIKLQIYGMKLRHILSPIKSMITHVR